MRIKETRGPRNFLRSPFARYEAALAKERREERLKQDVEITGSIPVRKRRQPSPAKPTKLEVSIDPIVTASAALHAVKAKTTTAKIIEGWFAELAEDRVPEKDTGIQIFLKLAVGEAISVETAAEVERIAKEAGISPSELVALFIRMGLKRGAAGLSVQD